jgi:hypothetical protein
MVHRGEKPATNRPGLGHRPWVPITSAVPQINTVVVCRGPMESRNLINDATKEKRIVAWITWVDARAR